MRHPNKCIIAFSRVLSTVTLCHSFQIPPLISTRRRQSEMNLLASIVVLTALSATVLGEGVKVGQFNHYAHGIAGTVYAVDEKTLLIKGFKYDGAGPDAFFWAGSQGTPSSVGTILPYPFEGKFYEYEDQSAPILRGRFNGDNDITLTLPDTLKATDIKWLSVWCRAFTVDFGSLIFPDNLSLGDSPAQEPTTPAEIEPKPETPYDDKTEDLPPPVLSPIDNDISNVHNGPRYDQDADAYPESEPETEPETRPYSGANLTSCTNLMVMIVAVISWMVL